MSIRASFSEQIDSAIKNIKEDVQTIYNAACLEFADRVLDRTPVRSGRLIAQYYFSFDGRFTVQPRDPVTGRFISASEHAKTSPGYSSAGLAKQARSNARRKIAHNARLGSFTISNPTTYAYKAEWAGWVSTPPYRMIGRTKAEWPAILAQAIALNRRK